MNTAIQPSAIIGFSVTKKQVTLDGHSGPVSCIATSPDYSLIASGEVSGAGQPAEVLLWDFGTKQLKHKLMSIHEARVVSLSFSPTSQLLASVGEEEQLVIWDVLTGSALTSISSGSVHVISFTGATSLITAGRFQLKQWQFDCASKKLTGEAISLGSLKRDFTCLTSDGYCGTKSGDFVELTGASRMTRTGPSSPFPGGISCLVRIPGGDLLVGTGGGVVAKVSTSSLRVLLQSNTELEGAVSSMTLTADSSFMFVGTTKGKLYWVNCESLHAELRSTCHTSRINQIVFPRTSDVVGSCGFGSIRLWSVATASELLEIQLPNIDCLSMFFSPDGKLILSGWSDGQIRAFTPQTGKLVFVIHNAHKEVSALSGFGDRIVSGGVGGEVRIWLILCKQSQELESNLKEHRAKVTAIRIRSEDDLRAVSSSLDGSVVVWDLAKRTRLACMFVDAKVHSFTYSLDYAQIVTVGSDRRMSFFDVFAAGPPIRAIEGAPTGELSLVVSAAPQGIELLITGCSDGRVRVWDYDRAELVRECLGHSSGITAGASAGQMVVTGDAQGAMCFWKLSL